MDAAGAAGASTAPGWSSSPPSATGDRQRHPLRAAHWLSVARLTARSAAVGDSVVVLPPVAGGWCLGADQHGAARAGAGAGGTRAHAQCGDLGSSVSQDDRKRGPRGYDGGKKIHGRQRHLLVESEGL